MSQARFLVGDVSERLAELPDASVDLCMTSPPFYGLRSYLPHDSEHKAKEIGSEPTPGEYLDALLDVVEEVRRVLAPHGSLCWELGDTYSGSGGAGGDYTDGGFHDGQNKFDGSASRKRKQRATLPNGLDAFPEDKCLMGIPDLFQFCLSWGFNPLTGRTTPRWRTRNKIAWCRPNPPVGALGDKMRPATSYLTVACTGRDRYFDLDAVRQPYSELTMKVKGEEWASGERGFKTGPKSASGETGRPMAESRATHAGAPPLDYWVIPTQPYKGAHFATWPTALCIKPIEAMCPRKVCRVCGEPSRRITGEPRYAGVWGDVRNPPNSHGRSVAGETTKSNEGVTRIAETLGWTDCGHDDWRPGLVLDCFCGSGTTLQVATGHGRDAIGIDLDPRNAELAYERIGGLFLTIESQQGAA